MEFTVPDTLVLKIIEHDTEINRPDTTLYIFYDKNEHKYIIRGKRYEARVKSCTYSYECEFAHDLADFIEFLIDEENKISYILYNYDNLPSTSNEITYDFLKENDAMTYEIAGYDNKKFYRRELLKNLRMLRNIHNYY
jgi:hypothetical protein